ELGDALWRVTGGATDEPLARLTIRSSVDFVEWTQAQGVEWQRPLRGTLHLARTNMFMLGGGTGMLNSYYATAARLGVQVVYDADVQELEIDDACFCAARFMLGGREPHRVAARAVVVASGGFEANLDWLREYWGAAADNFVVRGTPYNRGRLLRVLLDQGAQSVGDPREFHCVAVDARAPQFDGGVVTRLGSGPFGVVVNRQARGGFDGGGGFWPQAGAVWWGVVAWET